MAHISLKTANCSHLSYACLPDIRRLCQADNKTVGQQELDRCRALRTDQFINNVTYRKLPIVHNNCHGGLHISYVELVYAGADCYPWNQKVSSLKHYRFDFLYSFYFQSRNPTLHLPRLWKPLWKMLDVSRYACQHDYSKVTRCNVLNIFGDILWAYLQEVFEYYLQIYSIFCISTRARHFGDLGDCHLTDSASSDDVVTYN